MVPLLPLRDGVRALPISFFRQSMPSFYMNAPDCICSPGRLPLGAFCTGRDDQAVAFRLARSAISIHAPRVGRDAGWAIRCIHYSISIHAPRAGCDYMLCSRSRWLSYFNPRTPCGVRPRCCRTRHSRRNFNPRTPCGVRLRLRRARTRAARISIHAPRAGCDPRPKPRP